MLSVVDTLNKTEKMDEADSVKMNSQIDAPINSSLIQSSSNKVIEVGVNQNDD
jgi:hypothetical protein